MPLHGTNGAIPTYTTATGVGSGPAYGTGFTTTTGFTGTPSSTQYDDPYYGGRAPEYINWTFGIQRQLLRPMTLTVSYVGSEGHFLQTDGGNGRGYWSDESRSEVFVSGDCACRQGCSDDRGLHEVQSALPGELQYRPGSFDAT